MPRDKPPVIDGLVPDKKIDLDDRTQLSQLKLDPKSHLKLADHYCHYPKCDWAVIEYKSRSLKDCVKQLEITAKRLANVGKKVDIAIVISNGMNKAEKHLFRKRKHTLFSKITRTPIHIKTEPIIHNKALKFNNLYLNYKNNF